MSTYESASTRRFRLGRVDNIRANSPAALEWVKAMIGEVLVSVSIHKFTTFTLIFRVYLSVSFCCQHSKFFSVRIQFD